MPRCVCKFCAKKAVIETLLMLRKQRRVEKAIKKQNHIEIENGPVYQLSEKEINEIGACVPQNRKKNNKKIAKSDFDVKPTESCDSKSDNNDCGFEIDDCGFEIVKKKKRTTKTKRMKKNIISKMTQYQKKGINICTKLHADIEYFHLEYIDILISIELFKRVTLLELKIVDFLYNS